MRKLVGVIGVALLVVAVVLRRGRHTAPAHAREVARAAAVAPVAAADTATDRPAKQVVRRLSPDDQRALRAQIASSLERRRFIAASSKDPAPAPGTPARLNDDPTIPLEQVGKQVQDALRGAVPLLAACYPAAGSANGSGSASARTALAQMVMISDPDLGTVIDTSKITSADGATIAPALDDCLRTAIESLALPPLGLPGRLPLQYTFRFD